MPARINEPAILPSEVPERRTVLPERFIQEWGLSSNVVRVPRAIDAKIRRKHPDVLSFYDVGNPTGWLSRLVQRDDALIVPVQPGGKPAERWQIWTTDNGDDEEVLVVIKRSRHDRAPELVTLFKPHDPNYRASELADLTRLKREGES